MIIVRVPRAGEMVGEADEAVEGSGDPFGDGTEILGDLGLIRGCSRVFFQSGDIPPLEISQVLPEKVELYSGGFVGGSERGICADLERCDRDWKQRTL